MFALPHGESCAEETSQKMVSSCQCAESQRAQRAMPDPLRVRRLGFAVGLGRFLKVNRLRGQKERHRRFTHSSLCLPLSSLQRGLISSVTRCKSSRKYQHLLTLPLLHATVFGQLFGASFVAASKKPTWPNQPLKLALPMYVQRSPALQSFTDF